MEAASPNFDYFREFFDMVGLQAGNVPNETCTAPAIQNDTPTVSGVSPTTQAAIDAQVVDLAQFDPALIDVDAINALGATDWGNMLVQKDVDLLLDQPRDSLYADEEEQQLFNEYAYEYANHQEVFDLGGVPPFRFLAPPLILESSADLQLAASLRERRELEQQNPYAQVRMPDQPAVQDVNTQQVLDARAAAIARNRTPLQLSVQAGQQQQLALPPPQQPLVPRKQQIQQPVIQQPIAQQPQAQVQAPVLAPIPGPVLAGLLRGNRAAVQTRQTTRLPPHNYVPLGPTEPTFPRDQAAQDIYLRQLYDAFIDITHYLDTSTLPFAIRLFIIASNTGTIRPHMVSTVCQKLLSLAMALHTVGPRLLPVRDEVKMKNVYKYRRLDFAGRINSICELLRLSKSRCQSLLKFEGIEMVVGTAPLLVKQTIANDKANKARAQNLKVGKALLDGQAGGAA